MVQAVLQELLEAEMTEVLGAEKGERTPARLGYRSGYYGRTLVTRVGKLELRVPQDRQGRFSTELFERYQRSEKALVAALAEIHAGAGFGDHSKPSGGWAYGRDHHAHPGVARRVCPADHRDQAPGLLNCGSARPHRRGVIHAPVDSHSESRIRQAGMSCRHAPRQGCEIITAVDGGSTLLAERQRAADAQARFDAETRPAERLVKLRSRLRSSKPLIRIELLGC